MSDLQTVLDAIDAGENSLCARLRAGAVNAEARRQIDDELVAGLRDAGVFRMWRPKSLGGLELDCKSGVRVLEEISRADVSAGWNAHISNVVDVHGAWFPDSACERVFGGSEHIFSGALNPPLAGTPVEREGTRGVLLNGRAPFASGIGHADHMLALAALPPEAEGGPPSMCFTMVPVAGLIVHAGTWETLGMGATGSFEVEAKDLFVPADQLTALMPRQTTATAYATQPLYRLSMWPLVSALAAPILGLARTALDDFVQLATVKVPFYTPRPLRERGVAQSRLARAEATLGAARAYFYEAIDEAMAEVAAPDTQLSQAAKYKIQLATCHVFEHAAAVVRTVYELAGSSGFRRGHDSHSSLELRFEKYLRDASTITQHAFGSTSRYESVGQALLGLDSDWPFFAF